MESVTAKKKYCNDICRVYYNREKKGSPQPEQINFEKGIAPAMVTLVKNIHAAIKPKEVNNVDRHPGKLPGESIIDWKIRTGQ